MPPYLSLAPHNGYYASKLLILWTLMPNSSLAVSVWCHVSTVTPYLPHHTTPISRHIFTTASPNESSPHYVRVSAWASSHMNSYIPQWQAWSAFPSTHKGTELLGGRKEREAEEECVRDL